VSDTELRFYTEEEFNTIHDVDFDTRSLKTAGWMRFAVGSTASTASTGCLRANDRSGGRP